MYKGTVRHGGEGRGARNRKQKGRVREGEGEEEEERGERERGDAVSVSDWLSARPDCDPALQLSLREGEEPLESICLSFSLLFPSLSFFSSIFLSLSLASSLTLSLQ